MAHFFPEAEYERYFFVIILYNYFLKVISI